MNVTMIGAQSHWTLCDEDGQRVAADKVEEVVHDMMIALLEIETDSNGIVHSAAVSASLSTSEVTIEFSVTAGSIDDASQVIKDTLNEAIQGRLGHGFTKSHSRETSRDLELVDA